MFTWGYDFGVDPWPYRPRYFPAMKGSKQHCQARLTMLPFSLFGFLHVHLCPAQSAVSSVRPVFVSFSSLLGLWQSMVNLDLSPRHRPFLGRSRSAQGAGQPSPHPAAPPRFLSPRPRAEWQCLFGRQNRYG